MRRALGARTACVAGVLALVAACGAQAPDGTGGSGGTAGTGGDAVAAGFPMTLDRCGEDVEVPAPPQAVVTVAADSAAALAAVGAADRVVARASEGGAPLGPYAADLEGVPQISEQDAPSLEVVIGEGTDLVVGYDLGETTQALTDVGIPVLRPAWKCAGTEATFEETWATLETYGELFGTQDVAAAAVEDLAARVDAVAADRPGRDRTAVNVYIAEGVTSVYGGVSASDTVMDTLGLTNVFADVPQRIVDVSAEEILDRDPDVVILTYGGSGTDVKDDDAAVALLGQTQPLDQLTAVREGRVIPLNFVYLVGGPLAVDGLETVAERLVALP